MISVPEMARVNGMIQIVMIRETRMAWMTGRI